LWVFFYTEIQEIMISNLLFLSHGLQLCMFLLLVGLVLVFMKMSTLEQKVSNLENSMTHYVTAEEYMESFNNMFDAKNRGENVSPFTEHVMQ
jgi:hypothetical protein